MSIMKTLTINGQKYDIAPVVPATSVTLLAKNWVADGDVYSQIVEIPGVTVSTKVDLQPTLAQLEEFHHKVLGFVAKNEGGTVKVYAIGDKPDGDHTIQITLTEVEGTLTEMEGTGKIRGNTVGTTMPRSDWNQTDPSKADFIKNKPDLTPAGIGAAPAGFGLGVTAWRDDVPDNHGGTGFFALHAGATNSPFNNIGDLIHIGRTENIATQLGIDHLYGRPDLLIRKRANDGWGDWRHINPRMLLNTEYLTNEVWQDKDVYIKALSFETLASSGYASVTLGLNVTPIAIHGIAYNSQYICDLSAFRDVDEVFYQTSNGRIMIHSSSAGAADYKAIVVVKYTKN